MQGQNEEEGEKRVSVRFFPAFVKERRATYHVQRPSNVRRRTKDEQHGKVDRASNDRDELVPAKQNEDAINPVRDLRRRSDHAPLRFDVVRIGFAAEAVRDGRLGGGGEEREGLEEGEVAVLGGGGGVDSGGGRCGGRVGEGEGVGLVLDGNGRVEGDEGEDLHEKGVSPNHLTLAGPSREREKGKGRSSNARSPSPF